MTKFGRPTDLKWSCSTLEERHLMLLRWAEEVEAAVVMSSVLEEEVEKKVIEAKEGELKEGDGS